MIERKHTHANWEIASINAGSTEPDARKQRLSGRKDKDVGNHLREFTRGI